MCLFFSSALLLEWWVSTTFELAVEMWVYIVGKRLILYRNIYFLKKCVRKLFFFQLHAEESTAETLVHYVLT